MREFKNIAAFEKYLLRRIEAAEMVKHAGLDAAAALIEKTAYDEIGTYQPAAGPYGEWAELADSTKDDRVNKGFTENDPLLRTGEMRMSISRKVDGDKAVVGSTSEIFVYQELGTNRIPPRPVLGLAAYRTKKEVQEIIGKAVMALFTGKRPPRPVWKNLNDE